MTTENKTYQNSSLHNLIELAVADNDLLSDRIIGDTMNKSVDLVRVGCKLSIVIKSAYGNLVKVNAMFLRNETNAGKYLCENQVSVIESRINRLKDNPKYEYLIDKLFTDLSEIDMLSSQLQKEGIDIMSYI